MSPRPDHVFLRYQLGRHLSLHTIRFPSRHTDPRNLHALSASQQKLNAAHREMFELVHEVHARQLGGVHGFSTDIDLLRCAQNLTKAEARRRITAAHDVLPGRTVTGKTLPPRYPPPPKPSPRTRSPSTTSPRSNGCWPGWRRTWRCTARSWNATSLRRPGLSTRKSCSRWGSDGSPSSTPTDPHRGTPRRPGTRCRSRRTGPGGTYAAGSTTSPPRFCAPPCPRRPDHAPARTGNWADGGPTALNNLVLLCGHHHTVLHRGEWSVSIDDHHPLFHPPPWIPGGPHRNTVHRIDLALSG